MTKDTRVLVTGAGTGIGRGIATEFARQGASVVFHYNDPHDQLEADLRTIRDSGGRAEAVRADFRDIAQVLRLAKEAIGLLGGIDVLINNAGITFNAPLEQITPQQFDTVFNVNVRAMLFMCQAVVSAMPAGSSIINLGSGHAFQGMREHAIYAGTKGAIVSMSRALAAELGPKSIRVNVIAPGHVVVENHALTDPDLDVDAIARCLPIGRVGQPADIAKLAIFLASADAGYITGQTFVIDGGQTAVMAASDSFRYPIKQQWGRRYVSKS